MKKEKLKSKKGITLIALVVTIVVLLILAGVSINLIFSNDGIIKKAQEAADAQKQAMEKDQQEIEALGAELNRIIEENRGTSDEDNLKDGAEASCNGVYYQSLTEALNSAESGDEIMLEKDLTVGTLTLPKEDGEVKISLSTRVISYGVFSMSVPVCQLGSQFKYSIDEALADSAVGDTIVMLKDIELQTISIPWSGITLNLNGHSIK